MQVRIKDREIVYRLHELPMQDGTSVSVRLVFYYSSRFCFVCKEKFWWQQTPIFMNVKPECGGSHLKGKLASSLIKAALKGIHPHGYSERLTTTA